MVTDPVCDDIGAYGSGLVQESTVPEITVEELYDHVADMPAPVNAVNQGSFTVRVTGPVKVCPM